MLTWLPSSLEITKNLHQSQSLNMRLGPFFLKSFNNKIEIHRKKFSNFFFIIVWMQGRDMIIVMLLEVSNDSTSRGDVFHFYNFFEAICKGSYRR